MHQNKGKYQFVSGGKLNHDISTAFLDIDECVVNTHDCAAEANCTNTAGSFICTCKDGYEGNGKTCQGTEMSK